MTLTDGSVKYTGMWRRLAAALIDGVIIGLCYLLGYAAIVFVIFNFLQQYKETVGDFAINIPLMFPVGLVDGVLVLVPLMLISGPTGLFGMSGFDLAGFTIQLVWWCGPIAFNWLYHALLESSVKQATLGKMVLRIRVTDLDGRRISFGQATQRHFNKMLSTAVLCIGFLMADWTKKKQALHDKIAGCLVINSLSAEC